MSPISGSARVRSRQFPNVGVLYQTNVFTQTNDFGGAVSRYVTAALRPNTTNRGTLLNTGTYSGDRPTMSLSRLPAGSFLEGTAWQLRFHQRPVEQ